MSGPRKSSWVKKNDAWILKLNKFFHIELKDWVKWGGRLFFRNEAGYLICVAYLGDMKGTEDEMKLAISKFVFSLIRNMEASLAHEMPELKTVGVVEEIPKPLTPKTSVDQMLKNAGVKHIPQWKNVRVESGEIVRVYDEYQVRISGTNSSGRACMWEITYQGKKISSSTRNHTYGLQRHSVKGAKKLVEWRWARSQLPESEHDELRRAWAFEGR